MVVLFLFLVINRIMHFWQGVVLNDKKFVRHIQICVSALLNMLLLLITHHLLIISVCVV